MMRGGRGRGEMYNSPIGGMRGGGGGGITGNMMRGGNVMRDKRVRGWEGMLLKDVRVW